MWTGKPSSYDQLRVFGSTAYAHIRQDKLEPRAKKCIFLGYPENVKGYKLWCIEKGEEKCLISRDVVFNELEMPMLKTTVEETQKKTQVEVESLESQSEKINLSHHMISHLRKKTQHLSLMVLISW